ncbi:hypothetical protein [Clostridium sp. C8-1-8]|uniref:hypothetical protein n=1 Tax=Clostridium sp. C8-1-8 TaxID=2698831 RepID=UPI00136F8065|nr:hypothetical protein [Clostridium sp. C8-1-8]
MIKKDVKELRNEVNKAMEVLEKLNAPIEVRMIKTSKGVISGYYEDKEKLIQDITRYDGVNNIFFTLNTFSEDLIIRGKNKLRFFAENTTVDSDITRRVLLLIDVDPQRAAGISSSDEELKSANEVADRVRQYLSDNGFPDPVKACSGNGFHLLYKIDLPNTKEITYMIKEFLNTLDKLFSTDKAKIDTTTFNPSRITKLYGTIACKGDNDERRPHRRSSIIDTPEEFNVVEESFIKKIIGHSTEEEKKVSKVENKTSINSNFDAKEWLERNGIGISHTKAEKDRVCYVLERCPWNSSHDDKSASVTQFNNGGISAKCHHDSCSNENWGTLRKLYEPEYKEKKTENYDNNTKEERKSQADGMIELAMEAGDKFFHDVSNECYVAIEKEGNPSVYKINEESYKSLLVKRFFRDTRKAPSKDSVNQAVGVLKAIAQYEGKKINVSRRCTGIEDAIYYDLGDENWTFIKITENGWEVDEDGQILFIRRNNMRPQVMPEKHEDISIIDKHYRFKTEEDRILHTVSLVTKFLNIGNPITVYHGEKGASKTTTMRMDRSIVDPAVRDVISMPKSITDLSLVLNNNYMPCIDNIDNISAEKSDILCTAATGGGFSRRKLFTDDEETIYEFKVPVVLNGINVVATRPDLLDRSLLLGLERIPEDERKEERVVWEEFEKDKPKMLGAIFHIISKTLKIYPTVELNKLGRMADFTRWGYAVAEACGIGGEKFKEAYLNNQYKANDEAVSSNPIASAVIRLMETNQYFEGTPSELLAALNQIASDLSIDVTSKLWAREPNVLSRRLNEIKSNLLMEGITFLKGNTNTGRKIEIRKATGELSNTQCSFNKDVLDSFNELDSEVIEF